MSFWLNDVKEEKITGEFTLGGSLEPIPANTNVLAFVEEAKWDSYEGENYISLKWKVMAPNEYKNRIIFHKLKVMDADKTKASKAQKMLLSINFNAKGKLSEMKEFGDTELQKNLCNKPMMLNLQVWDLDGRTGNWVASVKPKGSEAPDRVVEVVKEDIAMTDDEESEMPF